MAEEEERPAIRRLNDDLRQNGRGGRILITQGVQALGVEAVARVAAAVAGFDKFTPDNDPHGEHDFGVVAAEGARIFWKIDYYDTSLRYHSPDPSDPEVTIRVMTIMLAEEY